MPTQKDIAAISVGGRPAGFRGGKAKTATGIPDTNTCRCQPR
jgi:hypothetical protein